MTLNLASKRCSDNNCIARLIAVVSRPRAERITRRRRSLLHFESEAAGASITDKTQASAHSPGFRSRKGTHRSSLNRNIVIFGCECQMDPCISSLSLRLDREKLTTSQLNCEWIITGSRTSISRVGAERHQWFTRYGFENFAKYLGLQTLMTLRANG